MRMSENLFFRMRMLKCDVSEWLSDEPPKMLELLFATKNVLKLIWHIELHSNNKILRTHRPDQMDTTPLKRTFLSSTFTSETRQPWVGVSVHWDIALYISFSIQSFIEYERRLKMSLVDYISSVGGLFGLFLGFSLLSFMEIFYWLGLNFIRNVYRGKRLTS